VYVTWKQNQTKQNLTVAECQYIYTYGGGMAIYTYGGGMPIYTYGGGMPIYIFTVDECQYIYTVAECQFATSTVAECQPTFETSSTRISPQPNYFIFIYMLHIFLLLS